MSDITQPTSPPKSPESPSPEKPAPEGGPRAEVLLVSAKDGEGLGLDARLYEVQVVDDPGRAMETLRKVRFDLFILDDRVISKEITSFIKEIKRRVPLVPVLVLSDNSDTAYHTDLMEAGADDMLTHGLSTEELHRRLGLMLKQHSQNRALARRNQHLHAITLLSRRLHSATDPYSLIQETIDLTCTTFGLYGMAIVLSEGDKMRLYAGHEGSRLYESTIHAHRYDPFNRAMHTGIVQIFQDINIDWHYTSIPVLPKARSAIIVPLKYQDYNIGSMGVFGTANRPLTSEDLMIYELFAAQFVVALQNVRHYETQHINVQSSQHLLRAWQRFITLNSFDDIAHTLRELVEDMPVVGSALVWLYTEETVKTGEIPLSAHDTDTMLIFEQLHQNGTIRKVIDQFDDRMQPISLWLGRGQQNPLGPLFRALRGQQLMVLPVTDSARLIGGVIASAGSNNQFSIEDVNLMESLAHAAGQALERITLMAAMREQTGRLEAILRSIYEGIFFVDESGQIAFINPQFTELTGIKPSEVLDQSPAILMELLTQRSGDAGKARTQLDEAMRVVLDTQDRSSDYPIVEVNLSDPGNRIFIEFVRIGTINPESVTWAGIIRDNTPGVMISTGGQSALLDGIIHYLRVPYSQVRSAAATIVEKHTTYTPKERDLLLRQLERNIESVGQLWDNFIEAYTLESAGLAINPEENNLTDIVNRVLDSRPFNKFRRQIRYEPPARSPVIHVDEMYIVRAINNVLQNAFYFSPPGATVTLSVEPRGNEVVLSVQDQGIGIPQDQLEKVFEPLYRATNNPSEQGAGLGLFIAREMIRRHGGRIWIESEPGRGARVNLALPVAEDEVLFTPVDTLVDEVDDFEYEEALRGGSRVPNRTPQTIMVIEGRSRIVGFLRKKLEIQGYELLSYRSGEEALRDLSLRRLDLILLDVNLTDNDGIEMCERIRRHSEVPIILMADEASEPQKVRGFESGADDYLARPMSEEELMARVKAMFKRQHIPDRTRKPLDLGNLYIDFSRREVFLNKKPVELTRIEYDLLHTLAINMDIVLTHKQLLEKVWGPEYQGETQYLWVNVSRLRKKLEPTPDSPRFIHNQPGIGYVFRRP